MCCILCTIVLLVIPVLGQWGESISDPEDGGDEFFHAADHYDFAILLSGTESHCYWHFARQNGRFYLTYMVQWVSRMTSDRLVAASIISPKGIPLSYTDNTMGQMNLHVKETGFYQMCFANYHNHFGEMRVFLNFGVFYEEEVEAKKEDEMDKEVLNSTIFNIKEISTKVHIRIQHMWRFYNVARMRRGADYLLLQSKSYYVNTWSVLQSFVIVMAGYIQLFFLKRFFRPEDRRCRC
ncbi:transmembrane emp24 domain-containing protein 6 isoform X1 [Silurus asotus]|uniref:Transmembrane emp24 domain-containing protein 6 isoform X1 n=1 Tax=Silurus asotus TaxID=30991 RepID=A0AAD5AIT4_SILAS|nr:transmembrane emp24 domain-containing protein 6 isoform X1 [Silurus asotus]